MVSCKGELLGHPVKVQNSKRKAQSYNSKLKIERNEPQRDFCRGEPLGRPVKA